MIVVGVSGKAGAGKDTAVGILREVCEAAGVRTTQLSFASPLKDICTNLFGWDRKRLDSDAFYKEGGLGGWVPKGKPGAKPIPYRPLTSVETGHCPSDGAYDPNKNLDYQAMDAAAQKEQLEKILDEYVELDKDIACEMLGQTRREVMQRVGTEAMRNGLHQDIWIIAKKLEIARGVYKHVDVGFLSDCRFMNELKFVDDQQGLTIRVDRTDMATLTDRVGHASELEWEAWKHWDLEVKNPGNMEEFRENLNGVLDLIGIELYATGRAQEWPDLRA